MPRITDTESYLLKVPLGGEIADSQTKTRHVEFLLVELITNDGVHGWGFNWNYQTGLESARYFVDHEYFPILKGEEDYFRKRIMEKLYYKSHFIGRVGVARVALSAIETALWDIQCKRAGLPLWKLLGAYREKVPIYSTDGGWLNYSAHQVITNFKKLVKKGYTTVKMKIRLPNPGEDYKRVQAVRDAIGYKTKLMLDVNTQWDFNTAMMWGKKLEKFDIYWLEEPLNPFDIRAHAKLARKLNIPIAIGETIYTKETFRDYITSGAAGFVQPDVTKLSGIEEWLEVAHLADVFGVPVVPHTNVQQKLHSQLVASIPNAPMMENAYESILKIWKEPPKIDAGYMALPRSPGIGCEVNQEVIEKYSLTR